MNIKIENVSSLTGENRDTLYIKDGRFAQAFDGPFDRTIDGTDRLVVPGLIDAHTHLRDPGYEYKEDIASGTRAAAQGGVTSVMMMPNTNPVVDNATVVRYQLDKARRVGVVNVFPIGAVSKGLNGTELAEIGLMKDAGIVAVSDDGHPVSTAELMKKAMRYAHDHDLIVIDHCEDPSMRHGVMNEGVVSMEMGVAGIPDIAETIQVWRDLELAAYLNLPIHIAHVSTRGAVEAIRRAKANGVDVTAETCPQYFVLTEDACRGYNTLARCNPPLRTEDDRQAVVAGLADGTLDMIVSDHAPHHTDEKDIEFALAKNGMTGLETLFALSYSELVLKQGLPLSRIIEAMTIKPATRFQLKRGTFDIGAAADVSIFDLKRTWTVDRFHQASKAHNTPFHGMTLNGVTCLTIVGGEIVYEREAQV